MQLKKVLIITYYWPPSGGPGVQRWLKFAKYLPDYNILPIVLTVDPSKAEYPIVDLSLAADVGADLEVYKTDCKGIYDWYKKITNSKTVPYSGFANESKPTFLQKVARFIRGNFFLPDARRGWIRYAYPKACELIEKHNIDTIITTGPPHSTHLIGLKIKKKYHVNWIVDFRDPWTGLFYNDSLYQTRWAKRRDQRYEQSVLDNCDHLLLVTDNWDQFKIDPDKILYLPNGFDKDDFTGKKLTRPAEFTICYTGTIAESYPIDKFLETLIILQGKMPFKLRFVGKISDVQKEAFEKGLGSCSVEIINFVPHDMAINYMLMSSVLLLLIPQTANSKTVLPGKIFEYMASSVPILFLGPVDATAAHIIQQAKAGAAFDYNDTDGISTFLLQQYQHHVTQSYPLPDHDFIRQFSRKALTKQLSEVISKDL